jgi:hypothetical protein
MSKRPAAAEVESQPPASPQDAGPNVWIKLLVSLLVTFHLTAVFVAPLAFASDYSSPLVSRLYSVVRPYATALYLNHGYFFFAPAPGPTHLVDYKVEFADGRPPVSGRFPDLATQRPRLLFHRHFMLSESLYNRFQPAAPEPEPSPPPLTATAEEKLFWQMARREYDRGLARWKHQQPQYAAMRRSVEEHLKAKYGGTHVTLTLVEHRLLTPIEIERGERRLDAAETFINLPETPPSPSPGAGR